MSVYRYRCPECGILTLEEPWASEARKDCPECNGPVKRVIGHVAVPPTCWPMTCVASGVHPEQAQELRDTLAKAGVPTEVNRDGDPIYTSASHRRKALEARGMFDRNAYY